MWDIVSSYPSKNKDIKPQLENKEESLKGTSGNIQTKVDQSWL